MPRDELLGASAQTKLRQRAVGAAHEQLLQEWLALEQAIATCSLRAIIFQTQVVYNSANTNNIQ